MLKYSELVTFHAPMPVSCWADGALDAVSAESMFSALMQAQPMGELVNPIEFPKECLNAGVCEGQLAGGNLTLVSHLLGTPYETDTKGKILFLEDVGEYTYSIDRMLTQLRLAGKFDDCAGVVFGNFRKCDTEYPDFGFTLREVIEDVVVPCGKPIFMGLRAGHCTPKLTLPLGVKCRMDAEKCSLSVLESAVK
jgi:muramoyltetrapeptide carboxypeptidase